jgi:hypothetical protein
MGEARVTAREALPQWLVRASDRVRGRANGRRRDSRRFGNPRADQTLDLPDVVRF